MAEERMLNDEILLGLIKANSGGGGTTNYNDLSNQPQINSVTLSGDKSASDLGLATANSVSGILDGQTIDSFADVETALAGKQNALTAGDYVVIENDKISVSKLKQGKLDLYSYEFVTTDASHTPKVKVIKKVNGETISETVYDEFQAASWMTFDNIIKFRYDASDSYKWKYQCLVTSNEHTKDTVVSWYWNQTVDYTETFDVGSSDITDLVTKGDMIDAMATKQDTLTFDDTPTDGSNNPVKSNGIYDALATKANTDMVAADFNAGTSYTAGNYCIYGGKFYKFNKNHSGAWAAADVDEIKIAGELSSLNSNLTNLKNESGDFSRQQIMAHSYVEFEFPADIRPYMLYTYSDNLEYTTMTLLTYSYQGYYEGSAIISKEYIVITDKIANRVVRVANNTDYNCMCVVKNL